jgi:hypothetical protein
MAVLKIALLGAPFSGASALASALNSATKASDWPALGAVATDFRTVQASAADYFLILLMGFEARTGCDFPPAHELCPSVAEAEDAVIRAGLASAGLGYQVLYGPPQARLAQAIQAIACQLQRPAALEDSATGRPQAEKAPPWVWLCDKCSDSQCEHRLLTALRSGRSAMAV